VLLELERRGADIGYVKTDTGLEVDFLARHPTGEEELIQVCADLTNEATRAREFRALAEAAADHRRAVQRVLVLDRDALAGLNVPNVEVVPAYEWLLKPANE